jgi:dTMP kinase
MSARAGRLVALEGGEGAGKSSLARRVGDWFAARGCSVALTFEPGASPLGRALRDLVLDGSGAGHPMSAKAEALLFAADRAEHVARVLRPALDAGQVVVTDRYLDSSLAYQGAGRGLEVDVLERVSDWASDHLRPDLTILLDVPVDVGLARVGRATDRIEAAPAGFHERVRAEFLRLAARAPERYLVVDASRPIEQVWADAEAGLARWWSGDRQGAR